MVLAAERRKNVATGASPWSGIPKLGKPRKGRKILKSCAPTGLAYPRVHFHGLTPVATFFRRSAAKTIEYLLLCKAPGLARRGQMRPFVPLGTFWRIRRTASSSPGKEGRAAPL